MEKREIRASHSVSAQLRPLINMTPALRQAIALLQMDGVELGEFLTEQAAGNPFLSLRAPSNKTFSLYSDMDLSQNLSAGESSLIAHVHDQIRFCRLEATEHRAALILIDALAPSGWLDRGLKELAQDHDMPMSHLETVLNKLQAMEPTGLFARDLSDCLRLQLLEQGKLDSSTKSVLAVIELLATGGVQALVTQTGLSECEVRRVLTILRGLDPKPGSAFAFETRHPILPDLILDRRNGSWHVEMNRSLLPELRVDESLFRTLGTDPSRDMRAAYGSARWITEAVNRRHSTVLLIGAALVHHQSDYFDRGPAGLRPLSQRKLAENLKVSESTVSRVVNSIHLQAPNGVVALKALFVNQVALTTTGRTLTPPQVRQEIQDLLEQEISAKPMTDARVTQILNERGISIARRTVAKYRALCGIPSIRERQRRTSKPLYPPIDRTNK